MLDVSFAKQKSQAMLEQVTQLQSADYPYSEPKVALGLLHDLFKEDLARLSRLDANADITLRHQVCAHSNVNVAIYLPVLGFLVRAAETRNTFELYDPLLRLCHSLCGEETKLVLSSEWNFSPITYPAVFPNLPDLIFIGLPACEAANSLIAPLAGHEFGHSVWRRQRSKAEIADPLQKKLLSTFVAKITDNWQEFSELFAVTLPSSELMTDLFLQSLWTPAYRYALRQIEEFFCDIIGLRLFGEGFLYAFGYMISPNLGERSRHYPALADRASAMVSASTHFGIKIPDEFQSWFSEPALRGGKSDMFMQRMADESALASVPDLIAAADKHISDAGIAVPDDIEREEIVRHFDALSPAPHAKSMASVINAGWRVHLDTKLLGAYGLSEADRAIALNDLVLKSLEVMEYNERIGAKSGA